MAMNDNNPIRRAQLISPFGTGSMLVTKYGVSVMTACLDYWFKRDDGSADFKAIQVEEFRIDEWRLERALDVDYFLQPPEYRNPNATGENRNAELTVPTVRFPRWHWCSTCHSLYLRELHDRAKRIFCENCLRDVGEKKGRKRLLVQVPFVAVCRAGHIEDFPFREWVHEQIRPNCHGQLKLNATGGATLSAQVVSCSCGATRPLSNIQGTVGNSETDTVLSFQTERGQQYLCEASSPWKGEGRGGTCGGALRGALRTASNVYFAKTKSSIYLPQESSNVPPELLALFDEHPVGSIFKLFITVGASQIVNALRTQPDCEAVLNGYSNSEIEAAIAVKSQRQLESVDLSVNASDDEETAFRRAEYAVLNREHKIPDLIVRSNPLGGYWPSIRKYFSKIHSVDRLRETRVLYGFSRIASNNGLDLQQNKRLLSKAPAKSGTRWLPAHIVHGEGIFLVFNEVEVSRWLNRISSEASQRIRTVAVTYAAMKASNGLLNCTLSPRFLLVHTFAHILINRLTFECGYNSASLRERVFVSDVAGAEMAAVLIYTAAGDSEGTMGGLVRMAKPDYLENCLSHAFDAARWCSNDPICLEAGRNGGQGPDSCNLAACHSCCLIPETACEEYNRFLDRAMVIGDFENPDLGFFNEWCTPPQHGDL